MVLGGRGLTVPQKDVGGGVVEILSYLQYEGWDRNHHRPIGPTALNEEYCVEPAFQVECCSAKVFLSIGMASLRYSVDWGTGSTSLFVL